MSCFVLSDDYGCTEALWLWKWLYTMSCLVQEPEENVNIINNYIQIMHKSTYLKTYLKKKIWSKKNGSFSSTQAPHQQVISHTKIQNKVNSSHFHFLTIGMLESSGFQKYSTLLVIQLFSRRLCLCHCLCIRLCLCICVPNSFLNSYYHKLSENVWVWGCGATRSEIWTGVTIAGQPTTKTNKER